MVTQDHIFMLYTKGKSENNSQQIVAPDIFPLRSKMQVNSVLSEPEIPAIYLNFEALPKCSDIPFI